MTCNSAILFKGEQQKMDDILDYKLIGANIKRLRRERGATQEYLAEAADISAVFVSQLENGKRVPSLETLCRIANALGAGLDELVYGENYTPEEAEELSAEEKALVRDIVQAIKRNRKQ